MTEQQRLLRQLISLYSHRSFPAGAESFSALAPGTVKGIIIMYHGWTGCPDSYNQISSSLNDQGFIVLTPLLPGQGINLGYGCDVPGTCVSHGTNPSELPTNKKVSSLP